MILEPVQLTTDFGLFLNADYTSHSGSCISHLAKELKDLYEPYGGLPESYCLANTMIHQLWWSAEQIDYVDLGRQLNIEVVTVSSIKQPAGCVVPWHKDTFFQIKRTCPDRTEPKVRANLHLEDWKLGHMIQFGDTVASHWQQGQGWIWDEHVAHLGANAGLEPKYTLQVSGFWLGNC